MPKALIVDDNEQNLYLLQALLRGHAYEVLSATNGVEALETGRRDRPDIVISDILMPVMDGFALCREWKRDRQLKEIPFVFYTATYTGPEDQELARNLGADRFIIKPQEPDAFVRMVEEVIRDYDNGQLSRARGTAQDDAYFRQHNQVLGHKLEDKMRELEKANQALTREVAERKEVEKSLRQSEERYRSLTEGALDSSAAGLFVLDADFRVVWVNQALERYFGLHKEEIVGKDKRQLIHGQIKDIFEDAESFAKKVTATYDDNTYVEHFECHVLAGRDREDRWLEHRSMPIRSGLYAGGRIEHYYDVTERKRAEATLRTSRRFLAIANRHVEVVPLLNEFVAEIRAFSGCAAVGIRLLDEEGSIPYEAYVGFTDEFYRSESPLSIHSDECMCINVIKGCCDPDVPFYTEGGSFSMNGTTRFLATVSEDAKGRTRNVCNEVGYESVALVPIRSDAHILGLIHVADPKEGMVPLATVKVLEETGLQLGAAIQRVQAEEELRRSREELRTLSAQLGKAEEEERRRLARELHDRVGQNLTALGINLNFVRGQLSTEAATETLARLDDALVQVEETGERIRDVMSDLRPAVLDDYGVPAALRWYCERFSQRTNIPLQVRADASAPRASQQTETALFRIAQEALTNVAKHSQASRVTVTLEPTAGGVRLTVADDGVGFDATAQLEAGGAQGWGMVTMRERAAAVGGRLHVESGPGRGTRIVVEVRN